VVAVAVGRETGDRCQHAGAGFLDVAEDGSRRAQRQFGVDADAVGGLPPELLADRVFRASRRERLRVEDGNRPREVLSDRSEQSVVVADARSREHLGGVEAVQLRAEVALVVDFGDEEPARGHVGEREPVGAVRVVALADDRREVPRVVVGGFEERPRRDDAGNLPGAWPSSVSYWSATATR